MNRIQSFYEDVLKIIFSALSLLWVIVTVLITLVLGIVFGIVYLFDKQLYAVLILMFVSRIASFGLYPIGFAHSLLIWRGFRRYLLNVAVTRDVSGNVYCGSLFNAVLIKGYSKHKFGNWFETISDNLGENKVEGTLNPLGKGLDYVLNLVDPNHSIKSIREDIKL